MLFNNKTLKYIKELSYDTIQFQIQSKFSTKVYRYTSMEIVAYNFTIFLTKQYTETLSKACINNSSIQVLLTYWKFSQPKGLQCMSIQHLHKPILHSHHHQHQQWKSHNQQQQNPVTVSNEQWFVYIEIQQQSNKINTYSTLTSELCTIEKNKFNWYLNFNRFLFFTCKL